MRLSLWSQPIKIICIVVHVLTGIYTRKIPSLLWSVAIGQGRVRHIVLSDLRVNDPYQIKRSSGIKARTSPENQHERIESF